MSYYVYGSGKTYQQYLQEKSFVADVSSATIEAGRRISMEISRQTRNIIASNEALSRENIRISERQHFEQIDAITASSDRITATMSEGFDQLSYNLQEISSGISEINATFHWGFSQFIAGIGHMNDALSELIKIAKTPVQTVAFNHLEIARDAFRQGLYQEALEELDKSINGDHTSPGYKLEWRFHQMAGIIRLGFVDCDISLVDLAKAEEYFLLAARYSRADYSHDSALAFLSASWAAYCQGKMKDALSYTEQAISLSPKLTEAIFQSAKVNMALGEVNTALSNLSKAIIQDRFYILKAAGDGDFQKYDKQVRDFIESLRLEKYKSIANKVQETLNNALPWSERKLTQDTELECFAALNNFMINQSISLFDLIGSENHLLNAINEVMELNQRWKEYLGLKDCIGAAIEQLSFWRKHSMEAKTSTELQSMDSFFSESENWPLIHLLSQVKSIEINSRNLIDKVKNKIIVLSTNISGVSYESIIKPVGLFHKAVTVTKKLDGVRDDFYNGLGELITSLEFCQIPSGKFKMGPKGNQYDVLIPTNFYLGKYLVTQGQWIAVMNNNPCHFKGDTNLPVENVSHYECKTFINKLNSWAGKTIYRLPTEEEWEYACRSASVKEYYLNYDSKQLNNYAWHKSNSSGRTHTVGQLKSNSLDLYDMIGNIWEWTDSWYDENKKEQVIRGGSYNFLLSDYLPCFVRKNYQSVGRDNNLGFRVFRIA